MITNKAQSAKTHTLQEIPYPNQQIYNNQKIKPFNNSPTKIKPNWMQKGPKPNSKIIHTRRNLEFPTMPI
jgi:hypothetical protein